MVPCIKIKFKTEYEAQRYLNALNQLKATKKVLKHVYLCPQCSAWHMTSVNLPARIRRKLKRKQTFKNKNL